jgi:hypothetical protein
MASPLPHGAAMTSALASTTPLRWAFQIVDDGSAFDVCVLPHLDLETSECHVTAASRW